MGQGLEERSCLVQSLFGLAEAEADADLQHLQTGAVR